MPYKTTADLPDAVRAHLPLPAQKVFLEVFNSAWDQYAARDDREALAHKVAWSAVKKQYQKHGDRWVKI